MILFTYQTVPRVTTSLAKMSENRKKFHPLIRFKKQHEETNKKHPFSGSVLLCWCHWIAMKCYMFAPDLEVGKKCLVEYNLNSSTIFQKNV